MAVLKGWSLTNKEHGRRILTFSHGCSNVSFQIEATEEQMKHFHLDQPYELHFTLENMHKSAIDQDAPTGPSTFTFSPSG